MTKSNLTKSAGGGRYLGDALGCAREKILPGNKAAADAGNTPLLGIQDMTAGLLQPPAGAVVSD